MYVPVPAARKPWPAKHIAMLGLLFCVLSGCNFVQPPLDKTYGRAGKTAEASSINGLSSLFTYLEDSGHRVEVSRRWGRAVKDADAVIWCLRAADDMQTSTLLAIDAWLQDGSQRKLILILPGYDAVVPYWEEQKEALRPADRDYVLARNEAARAIAESQSRLSWSGSKVSCGRLSFHYAEPKQTSELQGPLAGVRRSQGNSSIQQTSYSNGTIKADEDVTLRPLLQNNDRMLVGEATSNAWPSGAITMVANASFLLNYPLTKESNRVMLARFLKEINLGNRVVFLEADNNPPLSSGASQHHMLAAFGIYPLNIVLLHAMAAGFIYCFAVFPIFGRPRELQSARGTDFRLHPLAVGRLLARIRDFPSAQRMIQEWKQLAPQDAKIDGR